MYDFINPPIEYDSAIEDAATIELDSIDGNAVLADGFIEKVYPSQYGFDKGRIVDITDTTLTFKQCTMRAMIGLYVLKETYSTAEVNVYGKRYTFELKKFAVPNKTDFVTVHQIVSKSIDEICGHKEAVINQLSKILLEIQQDEWRFVE